MFTSSTMTSCKRLPYVLIESGVVPTLAHLVNQLLVQVWSAFLAEPQPWQL